MTTDLRISLGAFSSLRLDVDEYRRVAGKCGWRPPSEYLTIVEREILVYDTFYLLNKLGGNSLTFGGGTLLNWAYLRDSPRFSFDIDATYLGGETSKEELLRSLIKNVNSKLVKLGFASAPLRDQLLHIPRESQDAISPYHKVLTSPEQLKAPPHAQNLPRESRGSLFIKRKKIFVTTSDDAAQN